MEAGVWDEYFADGESTGTESPSLGDVILALEALTERQRFVIECRYGLRPGLDGEALTHREIAALMGVSHVTVIEHEQAALARLRSRIGHPTNSTPR